ncbi:DUF4396 domain-containing protein [Actinospica sp. MGRD01-02]|uniref:DUF4396 domain-containing protein n=1 Tax=Actinospica acidithermotolerans TaxID=2828514 RepID=A0A941IMB6_9ACTN|nr:DUF4396 domain-containing protein [Actinospica acidithermotolerans]MBR7830907.1 DUF4396 domain-containing protein [Actinospica acidithermotolerans]
MLTRPPAWIETIGWFSLSAAFTSVLIITADILRGHRQKMWIMNLVYPITALYWGPVALWFYLRYGRRTAKPEIRAHGMPDSEKLPRWNTTAKAVSHCGAGCTLGDIAAEWLVYGTGLAIAGKALYADFALDFAFAWVLGIFFQYFTIAPMRDISVLKGIAAAIKADTLSILAFQVGLFLGMWIYQDLIFSPGLAKTTATYWMLMQISMIIGFFTAWPVNVALVRLGWKERM